MTPSDHTHHSSYREMVLEHLFVGEVMKHCWQQHLGRVEMLKSQVDASGYDIVLESGGIMRHIQLKTSHSMSHTPHVPINIELGTKPSGCVIWMIFDAESLNFDHFLWFGDVAGQPLPSLTPFKVATHNKRNSLGVKTERPMIRLLPKRDFKKLDTIAEVVSHLFDKC